MVNLFAFYDKKDKTARFVVTSVTMNIIYLDTGKVPQYSCTHNIQGPTIFMQLELYILKWWTTK